MTIRYTVDLEQIQEIVHRWSSAHEFGLGDDDLPVQFLHHVHIVGSEDYGAPCSSTIPLQQLPNFK